jgi:hypothetical protein
MTARAWSGSLSWWRDRTSHSRLEKNASAAAVEARSDSAHAVWWAFEGFSMPSHRVRLRRRIPLSLAELSCTMECSEK